MGKKSKNKSGETFNNFAQFAIPSLTIGAQLLIALRMAEFGLIVNLLAQPFWMYSAWRSYKQAGQIGMLITTVILTIIIIGGVINHWILN
ncbi:MAG: hypothetical protein LBG64_00045 [Pseudomonadales bacterium]|nr:hypothetical protein [Pseudomonadales bacterium]